LWAIEGKVPQDREPIGMLARRLNRQLTRIRVPSRWMDHGRVNAGFIHLLEQIVLREGRDLPVTRVPRFLVGPDVNLCIDDQHGVLLTVCPMLLLTHMQAASRHVWRADTAIVAQCRLWRKCYSACTVRSCYTIPVSFGSSILQPLN